MNGGQTRPESGAGTGAGTGSAGSASVPGSVTDSFTGSNSGPAASSGGTSFCALGTLTGTWRSHYTQTNGDCGGVDDETLMIGSSIADSAGCTYYASDLSPDRCRLSVDFSCPTTNDGVTQHWVITMSQVSATTIIATGTLRTTHPITGTCRSTYEIDIGRL
jgi:hypothetical protein